MKKQKIILTVQSTGTKGKFRLGISYSDSIRYLKKRGTCVLLFLGKEKYCCKTTCGLPLEKGFDLYSKELNEWIKKNNYNSYKRGNPSKLIFSIAIKNIIELKFISKKIT